MSSMQYCCNELSRQEASPPPCAGGGALFSLPSEQTIILPEDTTMDTPTENVAYEDTYSTISNDIAPGFDASTDVASTPPME